MLLSLLLSGLRWHLSGLLELPLEQRLFLLLILAGEPFPFLFHVLLEERIFSLFFCFCGPFFCIMSYEHVVVEHQPAVLYCSTASTAQHSAISPHKAAKANTCRTEGDHGSKQTDNIYCTAVSYRKHNTAQHSTAKHSTAQHTTPHHSAISPQGRKRKYVPNRGRPRKQADR